jgi:hypothetical protein
MRLGIPAGRAWAASVVAADGAAEATGETVVVAASGSVSVPAAEPVLGREAKAREVSVRTKERSDVMEMTVA